MDTPNNIIPMTAEANNAPQTGKVTLSADEARSKLIEQFEKFKPTLEAYHDYANRCVTLAEEYHRARLSETCLHTPIEELTLAVSLDARETPKSLDTKLAQLQSAGLTLKRIVYDRTKHTYFLFV